MRVGVRSIPTLVLLATVIQAAPVSSVAENRSSQAIEAIRNDCHVDVGPSETFRVLDVVEVDSNGKNRTLKVRFRATVRGKALNGDMTFVCPMTDEAQGRGTPDRRPASESGGPEGPLSPKALIESEDAGGRYVRIVAWQRRLPSKLWSADVAYVTSVMGDGRREPVNQFLVCDKAIAKPCILAELDQRAMLTSSQQEGVLKLLAGITPSASLRPSRKQ
jgi:hypothetical protein